MLVGKSVCAAVGAIDTAPPATGRPVKVVPVAKVTLVPWTVSPPDRVVPAGAPMNRASSVLIRKFPLSKI